MPAKARATLVGMTVSPDSLPAPVASVLADLVGPVRGVYLAGAGLNNDVAAAVEGDGGRCFVKALRDSPRRRVTHLREAAAAPHVHPDGPRLLHSADADGWLINVYEVVDGRPADLSPGSDDVVLVADLLARRAVVPAPAGLDLPSMVDRFAAYCSNSAAFAGRTLLHTDLNPDNIMVTSTGVLLVDWSWASIGAAWLDTAAWCLWLIASGHTPAAADQVARTVPAYAAASGELVDAHAAATARVWASVVDKESPVWVRRADQAARAWAAYRCGGGSAPIVAESTHTLPA
jgi:hypothetical protein